MNTKARKPKTDQTPPTAHNGEIVKSTPTQAGPLVGFLLPTGYQTPGKWHTMTGTYGLTQTPPLCKAPC